MFKSQINVGGQLLVRLRVAEEWLLKVAKFQYLSLQAGHMTSDGYDNSAHRVTCDKVEMTLPWWSCP
jgi:hypothetical protein